MTNIPKVINWDIRNEGRAWGAGEALAIRKSGARLWRGSARPHRAHEWLLAIG